MSELGIKRGYTSVLCDRPDSYSGVRVSTLYPGGKVRRPGGVILTKTTSAKSAFSEVHLAPPHPPPPPPKELPGLFNLQTQTTVENNQ